MGRRIPTIPFSQGRPVEGLDVDPEVRRSHAELERTLQWRVRHTAHEIEERVEGEIRHHPKLILAAAGGVCFALGMAFGGRSLRLALIAVGGIALLAMSRERDSAALGGQPAARLSR